MERIKIQETGIHSQFQSKPTYIVSVFGYTMLAILTERDRTDQVFIRRSRPYGKVPQKFFDPRVERQHGRTEKNVLHTRRVDSVEENCRNGLQIGYKDRLR